MALITTVPAISMESMVWIQYQEICLQTLGITHATSLPLQPAQLIISFAPKTMSPYAMVTLTIITQEVMGQHLKLKSILAHSIPLGLVALALSDTWILTEAWTFWLEMCYSEMDNCVGLKYSIIYRTSCFWFLHFILP